MKSWKKDFKSSFSGFSLSDLTYKSWNSWKGTFSRDAGKVPEDIKNAYKQTLDLITVMDLPFKVELKLNGDKAVEGGARSLLLPTKIFDKKEVSEEDKVMISTGQAIHEAEHLKETSMLDLQGLEGFKKLMSHLIEDERIEDKLLSERPGFSSHIDKVREYDTRNLENSDQWKEMGGLKHGDFFQNLLAMVRYPNLMNEEVYEKHKEVYDMVRDVLSQPLTSTSDSVRAACEVKKIVDDYLTDMSSSDKVSLTNVCDLMAGDMDAKMQGGRDVDNSGYGAAKFTSRQLKDAEGDCRVVQGDSEYGSKTSVTFTKQPGDRCNYQQLKNSISPYISAVKKLLSNVDKNYEFSVRGMRSGILDVNKIAEAYQGIPQVYVRKGTVSTNKTRICILIDESGSMSGCYSEIAAQAAILMKEAFGSIPGIELYIYGHTAEDDGVIGSVQLFVYQEGSTYNPKYSLSKVEGRCQNIDHEAIDEVCGRVRKFTDDHVIMFVLSDGQPAAGHYGGISAMRQVRDVVMKREKQGFDIIQVNIGTELDEEDMKKMFDKYVYIKENVSEFPKVLSRIIKKAVTADKSTKVQVL